MKVAPSILSADYLHLEKDIRMLNSCADYIHLDVMDGSFVPNISVGFPVAEAVGKIAEIPVDAHLMVVNPHLWFKRFADCGVSMLSFHLEASGRRTRKSLAEIRELGMKAGLVINPDIPVNRLFKYIGNADYFVIMSVFAGFGGQKFIYESLDRVSALKKAVRDAGYDTPVEVDGGVTPELVPALKEAGADIIVAGSAVFRSADPGATVNELKK